MDSDCSPNLDRMENVEVYIRIRPFTDDEKEKPNQASCITVKDESTVVLKVPDDLLENQSLGTELPITSYNFKFSKIFEATTSQQQFFCGSVLDCADAFLNGQDVLVISHGPRKSGRTYTIQGDRGNPGLLPRLVDVLFNSLQSCLMEEGLFQLTKFSHVKNTSTSEKIFERYLKKLMLKQHVDQGLDEISAKLFCSNSGNLNQATQNNYHVVDSSIHDMFERAFQTLDQRLKEEKTLDICNKYSYSICLSFAEINGENIYDLLDQEVDYKNTLPIGIDPDGKPYIEGLLRISVSSADEALRVVLIGQRNHVMSVKKLKRDYAISHFLFCLELVRVTSELDPFVAIVNRLLLCDVGSPDEGIVNNGKSDGTTGRPRIDPSYLVLERCIAALKDEDGEKNQIPFEESKLTQLLSPFFTHNGCKIKIIVTVGPSIHDFLHSLDAMKFSSLSAEAVTHNVQSENAFTTPICCSRIHSRVNDLLKEASNNLSNCEFLDLDSLIAEKRERDERKTTCIYDYLVDAVQIMRAILVSEQREKVLLASEIRQQLQQEFLDHVVEIEQHYRYVTSERKSYKRSWWKQYLQTFLLNLTSRDDNTHRFESKDKDESLDGKYDLSVENRLLNVEVKSLRENLQKLSRTVAEMQLENSQLKLSTPAQNQGSLYPNPEECIKLVQQYKSETAEMKKLRTLCKMRSAIDQQQLLVKVQRLERESRLRQKLLLSREKTIEALQKQNQQLTSKLNDQDTRLSSKKESCSCFCAGNVTTSPSHRKRTLQHEGYFSVKKYRKLFDLNQRWKVSNKVENGDDEWFLYDLIKDHDSQCKARLPERKIKCRLIVRCERLKIVNGRTMMKSSDSSDSDWINKEQVPSETAGCQTQLASQHTCDNGKMLNNSDSVNRPSVNGFNQRELR